nr:hypothetical protein [Candidatus Saccharibacteria bacterium]
MARALSEILTELNSVYNPQRQRQNDLYNQSINDTNPMEQADLGGLEAAKTSSFKQIDTGANRRGMLFSGVPLAEQAQYVGQSYLPGVANLKNRYAEIRGNLKSSLVSALGNLDVEQNKYGRDIYGQEVARDQEAARLAEERRQFDERLAASQRADAASRGGGGGNSNGFNFNGNNPPPNT